MRSPVLEAPPAGVLDDLYNKLAPFQGQSLDLPAQLPAGQIASFLGPLGASNVFAIQNADVEFPEPYTALTVGGTFSGLGLGTLTAAVTFTLAADGQTLVAGLKLTGAFTWRWDLAPWLSLAGPSVDLEVSDSPSVPAVGTLGMSVGTGTPAATVTFQAPGPVPGTWQFTGTFPPATSLSHLFELLGGVNLATFLPGPLSALTDLSLEQAAVTYSPASGAITYMAARLGTDGKWPLLPNGAADVTAIRIQAAVADPAKTRTVSWTIGGTIVIGEGRVDVKAGYPHPTVSANLEPGTKISMSDFVSRFIDHDVDLSADITTFDFNYALDAPHAYGISAEIATQWTIPLLGQDEIVITALAFKVAGDDAGRTGMISGTTVIGRPGPNAKTVTFVFAADYRDATSGWLFSGTQTQGEIPLVQLATDYLPAGWQPDPASVSLNIEQLAVTLAPRTGSYSISGKADANWDILGGFVLEASAKVSYDGTAKAYTGTIEATLDEAFGITDLGLHVSYSFDPKVTTYAVDWKGLSGSYTIPADPTADRILEIDVKGWTLGSLIEELISFATGARFSLAAPWDLLDDIPLDCTLKFDITSGAVSFTYPLSVDLGIAALSGITVTYDPKATQKVSVALDGRFPWLPDASSLNWDASQPESTPAPPGGGSKYLELRVLALGQHVALVNPPVTYSVKEIADSVGALAEPSSDQLPTESTAITYSQASSWLIAADFGILQIDPPPKTGAAYFLDMALVFNDPDLYGLHIELEGPAAKIFAGLELDVLYRKVTDTVGVYQAVLQLPAAMRQFDVGEFSITLPTFAIAVYTNGDFELDVGFPWNNDFSRSFTIQAVIPPGIPVIGAGGFYFGKLSSATGGSYVPATTKGTFNPVIIFGIGLQVGLGKTIVAGPLTAGFTVTVLGIVEGVIARWHPNLPSGDDQGGDQLAGPYYFKLKGTVGIAAHLFGSIDFAVVKASVDVSLIVTASITYESYRAIPITVSASISVRVTLEINLGLFSINLHFSFAATISETFTIGSDQVAPWDDAAALEAPARDLPARHGRLLAARSARLFAIAAGDGVTLTWTNLQAGAAPTALTAYCTPAFTVVGDGASTPQQQTAAYVLLLWIDSVNPDAGQTGGADTSFEALAKQVLRWAAAAAQAGPVGATDVDDLVLSDDTLEKILSALADPTDPLPIQPSDVDTFLQRNAVVNVSAPTGQGSATATFFPMPPQVELSVASLGIGPYTFGSFNSYDTSYLTYLQQYFSALDVQVQQESGNGALAAAAPNGGSFSVASFVYADYFTMVARQMVEAARDALRDLKLPLPSGQSIEDTVAAINTAGQLDPTHAYTPAQLFEANAGHPLASGLSVQIACTAASGDTLTTVAQRYAGQFTAAQLATASQGVAGILSPGTAVQYPGIADPYIVPSDPVVALTDVATALGVAVADLIAKSNVITAALAGGVALLLPVAHTTAAGDTLGSIAASFGVPVTALGEPVTANGALVDLFAAGDSLQQQFLNVPHLPQYRLGDLIEEAQQSLAIQRLSGMVGRYFLHGVRLPTDATGADEAGLFALTGQQIPVGDSPDIQPFDIALSCDDAVSWVQLS